jgi:hypothetical protein
LVEFNQGWNHDNYTTVRILDKVYKLLNKWVKYVLYKYIVIKINAKLYLYLVGVLKL